ncbi:MAG: hypothetical protein EPN79_10645 [Burkholderiaceae bacterium]|nr:MAG: hypothetical protein EPN79_10645 [Burkholderiaceae bacterium]TBR76854.1 MAG: hypothetical protein EPN64_06430 [Burkholderiaceae bacterium]
MSQFTWKRYGGYECSSQGDRRFSAFAAYLPDGRTIEHHYQCDVKGYDPGGTNWRLGKGKPPLRELTPQQLLEEYAALWRDWAARNPELMSELRARASAHGGVLSDRFATTPVNQANALTMLLNEQDGQDDNEDQRQLQFEKP